MPLSFNRGFHRDLDQAMAYYQREATGKVAGDFFSEVESFVSKIAARPRSFPIWRGDMRRANLRRFPYHMLFRIAGSSARIFVLKQNQRDPAFGIHRR
jgi:toxin ParE1/3/4